MSRPNTRSKNKRQKPEDAEASLSEILRKIHITGEVSENDIYQLYSISKPVCEGCRINLKDSPNCFCGLIPASNGTRKCGLWQKMSEIISSLGPNPCHVLRTSLHTPAGLTNLGATCYANSILQCLYMNTSFRAGIFSLEVDLLNNYPVLNQLTRLFAQLHSCKKAFIDSAPFINTLELDNGVQQDSHEFLTLFFSLLERSLDHSSVVKTKNMVQDLFRGRMSHVTQCSVCGRESEASSKMEDFYELELNIKGLSNLYESLEDYFSVEELHGENQYFCEACGTRVNAARSIKLRELPLVLNFQLKRYVFLPKTTAKKKITSVFSFPRQLNMDQILNEQGESELAYELSAILIHKGTAANSGHYVAHIKDENTGQWWEFDDEHVSALGSHPFGEGSSKVSVKPVHSGDFTCYENSSSHPDGAHNSIIEPPALIDNFALGKEIFSSSDAYMLMYNRKKIKQNVIDTSNSLPLHLREEMHKLNASYGKACEEHRKKEDGHVAFITERRHEVKSILSEATVHSLQQPFVWISTDWLRQWADSINPCCIDNSVIQCIHGKIPFTKVSLMKRITHAAWAKLLSKYGGGPTWTNETYCIECIKNEAKIAICADDYRSRRASMKQIAEAALAGNNQDDNLYYVSRMWLLQWLRRKNIDSPCEADAGPTASLRCPHNNLLPDQAAGAKRVVIPENLWLFFCESANAVKPDDLDGCRSFSVDSKPCEVCYKELTDVACLEDCLRTIKLKQRQNHEKLFMGKSFALYPSCKYYLMPSSWLTNWRAYITTTGKNISFSSEPEMLEASIDSLICEQHSLLLERPPELLCKRGVITQKVSSEDGLTLVPEHDWTLFCNEWNVTQGKGIHAEIHFSNKTSDKLTGLCKEKPISDIDLNLSNDDANDDLACRNPFIRTHPEICEDCIGERESCALMHKLNYCDEDIRVYLVAGKEAPKSLIEASGTIFKPERRTSKRSRKSSYGNSVNLKVSSSTTIYLLKMMIWESFGVVKENQKLHKGSVEIDGDIATLADKNIFPGDVLWVIDTEIHENRDIADELSEQKIELHKAEEGFRGSLLTSDAPIQEWQDLKTLS